MTVSETHGSTESSGYTERLRRLEGARWKRVINAQAPYRWNIRRLGLGRTLDVGCGIGRNLSHLGGDGVGVDHNAASVEIARQRGLTAFTPDEFFASEYAQPEGFDSMLVAHVLEHMPADAAIKVVDSYLPCVKRGGRVVVITPQEKGYTTDATHVRFVGFPELAAFAADLGLVLERQYSFPLPRAAGRFFAYNEFVQVARKA